MDRLSYRVLDDPRLRGWIVTEKVKCGRKTCPCSTDRQRKGHGPYVYLRYPVRDPGQETYRLRRLYLGKPGSPKVRKLRQAIRQAKAKVRHQWQQARDAEARAWVWIRQLQRLRV